jgi:LuxR family maltose regulon positive regulatory protein
MRQDEPAPLGVLQTKIDPPRLPRRAIDRPRLLSALAGPARWATVSAPAGYGKTILVRQFVESWPHPSAWVTADPVDDDPITFLAAVIEALSPIVPMGGIREQLPFGRPERLRTEVLPGMSAAMATVDVPFALVIDDVHQIQNPMTLDVVDHLLDATPHDSRILLAGRSIPIRHYNRRRLSDDLVELSADDLAFTPSETGAALHRNPRYDLGPEMVEELSGLTEGWPAALDLAVLALDGQPDPSLALRSLIADGGNLADYIEEEMLAGISAADRAFLLHTSILDRLSGPLCDAVTGTTDSRVVLDRLVADGNLFVVPLTTPGSYRYHHLWQELLLGQLRRTDPAGEPELHRRAAAWLLDDRDDDRAVRHALASGDLDLATDVVYRLLFPSLDQGAIGALERWLDAFPPGEVRRRAPLLIAHAWTAVSRGRTAEVADILALLDQAPDTGPLPDGTISVEVGAAALNVLTSRGGVKNMVANADVVLAAGPNGSPWWGFAQMQRAVAVHLAGADDDPVALFDRAERATRGEGATHAVTLAHCGVVRLQRNDDEGYELVDRSVTELHESGSEQLPLTALVFTVLAYAEALRGRIEASEAAAATSGRMLETVGDAIPRGVAHHRLILADAALLRHDLPAAARDLAKAQEMLPHEPDAVLLHEWADRISRRTSARRQADGDSSWSQLSAAELRVLAELPSHRSLEEIGTHLYVSRNTVKSHTIAIYRKLGVSGRSAAVDRATELGLLAG